MNEKSVVVLLPTLYRPDGLRRVLDSLRKTAADVACVVTGEFNDREARNIALDEFRVSFVFCMKERQGPAFAWNKALGAALGFDIYVLGSDDIEFRPGWLEEGLRVLHDELNGSGLVAFNDGTGKVERAGFATQYMMTRDFIIDHNGGVAACPYYPVDFVDVEASIRAQCAGCFAYAPNARVVHHWREVDDEGYRRADTKRKEARRIFNERKAAGFPDDYEPILRKVEHANRT